MMVVYILTTEQVKSLHKYKESRSLVVVTTWEPASCLPPSIISEFECGVQRDLTENIFSSGGQTLHTICSQATTSLVKRPRLESVSQNEPG